MEDGGCTLPRVQEKSRTMKKIGIIIMIFAITMVSCNSDKLKTKVENLEFAKTEQKTDTLTKHLKSFNPALPTIGLLMYNGVLQSEVIATSDVFSKPTEDGKKLFNVISIAETENPITTEEGMHFVPDYTFENCPKLTVLFVPSAYDMYAQVHNQKIVDFIKEKNKESKYTVSNCAGAQLIGKSGIADGHKIVTWIGGGEPLQKDFPNLKVQNDSLVTFVEDGKFSSSNGNLASYISALNLLEKMTSSEHRKFVESYLYLDRLQNWNK
jgi:transcriptional regulator GlxA family with amidase domain